MRIVVVLKGEHALSVTVAGEPDYELEPYTDSEFLAKGVSGVSIEFQRDATGTVAGLALTQPTGIYYASKTASA